MIAAHELHLKLLDCVMKHVNLLLTTDSSKIALSVAAIVALVANYNLFTVKCTFLFFIGCWMEKIQTHQKTWKNEKHVIDANRKSVW